MTKEDKNKLIEDTAGYNRKDFLNLIIKQQDRITELEKTIIEQEARYYKKILEIENKIAGGTKD